MFQCLVLTPLLLFYFFWPLIATTLCCYSLIHFNIFSIVRFVSLLHFLFHLFSFSSILSFPLLVCLNFNLHLRLLYSPNHSNLPPSIICILSLHNFASPILCLHLYFFIPLFCASCFYLFLNRSLAFIPTYLCRCVYWRKSAGQARGGKQQGKISFHPLT